MHFSIWAPEPQFSWPHPFCFDGDPQAWPSLGNHCKGTEPREQGQQCASGRMNTPGRLTGICWASSKGTGWPRDQVGQKVRVGRALSFIIGRPASQRGQGVCQHDSELQCWHPHANPSPHPTPPPPSSTSLVVRVRGMGDSSHQPSLLPPSSLSLGLVSWSAPKWWDSETICHILQILISTLWERTVAAAPLSWQWPRSDIPFPKHWTRTHLSRVLFVYKVLWHCQNTHFIDGKKVSES